jgi:CIC family chloride channel protein
VLFNVGLLRSTAARTRLAGPNWLPAAVTGAVAGIALLLLPGITGVGHGLAEDILSGNLQARHVVLLTLALFVGKFVLTLLSYATGVPGGIFAPMLVMGSCLGYAFGSLSSGLFPHLSITPTVFATIGMAAFLTGSVRAPLTAVVLIVEMTNEYSLLFALLLGCFLAYATAELLHAEPIYDALLTRELKAVEGRRPDATEVSQFEVLVEPDSLLADRKLRDIGFPPGARVVAIARHGREVIPHGETRLEPGDLITVVIEQRAARAALRILESARGM